MNVELKKLKNGYQYYDSIGGEKRLDSIAISKVLKSEVGHFERLERDEKLEKIEEASLNKVPKEDYDILKLSVGLGASWIFSKPNGYYELNDEIQDAVDEFSECEQVRFVGLEKLG